MKYLKRTLLAILMLVAIVFLFRGWFYRQLVTYKSVGIRANYLVTEKQLSNLLDVSIDKEADLSFEQIIKLGLKITSKQLNFTFNKNDKDPNKLVSSKNANCVGYSSFFASTCNYLLKKYNLNDKWSAKPQIGKIYFLGMDVHKKIENSFFKDHDLL